MDSAAGSHQVGLVEVDALHLDVVDSGLVPVHVDVGDSRKSLPASGPVVSQACNLSKTARDSFTKLGYKIKNIETKFLNYMEK